MAVQRYHRNRRKVNVPGAPLPRMAIIYHVAVVDLTGVVTVTFDRQMVLDQTIILGANRQFGPALTVTFPAAPTPSTTLIGQNDTPPAADLETVDVTEWNPHLRGPSGEWVGWGAYQVEHV